MIKLRKKQKGFTLVELLIVIAIIAVLAAVVTPVALSAINDSKATAVYAEIKSIETADLTYYVQTSGYGAIEVLSLSGLTGDTTKNARYALRAGGTGEPARVLTVDLIASGINGEDVMDKSGATYVTDGVTAVSDDFGVEFKAIVD